MEHVVVTGGAGFIGSHLVEKLLEEGYRVTVIDNFATGHIDKLKSCIKNPHLCILNHDIIRPFKIYCDYIINAASRASPKDFKRYPIDILMTNSQGTKNVLDVALETKATMVHCSTSEVYGEPLIFPQDENYRGNVSPTGIRSCYDESKRFAEALIAAYFRRNNIDVRIARIFNTFGPRMNIDDGRVIPNFVTQSLRGEPITIYGDGKQSRSFCYIDDLVDGLLKLLFAPKEKAKGEIFNMGNPSPISIKNLAKEIIDITNSESELTYHPLPEDDPSNRLPDITKIKNVLGWKPKISRKEGLRKTVQYFKNKLSNSKNNVV